MIRAIIISVFCILSVLSMTTTKAPHHHTHRPRPSLEPVEHETFRFTYEPHTHKMVVVVGLECYVFSLSDAERLTVHTDAGIKALEIKLLSALSTNAVVTTEGEDLDAKIEHACGGRTETFYKEATS